MKRVSKQELTNIRLSIAEHGFWFVDIPRTSSSSVRAELGRHFGPIYGKNNVMEKQHATQQTFGDHISAKRIRDFLGQDAWNEIFTFTIVRNPWDRIYSMYNYRKKLGRLPKDMEFRDYVLALSARNSLFDFHGFYFGAWDYITDDNGEIMVDFVAKYENRAHDLKFVASQINIEHFGELSIQSASPKGAHYSNSYDPETREIISTLYEKDIALFKYKFDDLP
ncbi:MAG: sulfotransferase family 2 domain-containing protein [bacterium]